MKNISKLLVLSLFGLMVTACGGQPSTPTTSVDPTTIPPTSSEPSNEPHIKEPVKISMWVKSDKNSQLYQNMVESFKTVEPNVTVELSALEDVGNYNDLQEKVMVGLTAKQYPNLVQAYPGHVADYMANNVAVDVSKYMNDSVIGWTDAEKAVFNTSAGEQFGVDGTYCLPFNKSSEVLYYNRTKLVGLDLTSIDPTINEGKALNDRYLQDLTWEELFNKLAPALITYDQTIDDTLINNTAEHWGVLFYEDDANHFITTLKQYDVPYTGIGENGKGQVLFNNDEAKALKKWFCDAVEARFLTTRWSSGGQYSSYNIWEESSLFAVNSTVGASYFYQADKPWDIGIGHVPYAEGHKRYAVEQGTSLAFLSHNDELQNQAAWLFYKHMTSYENALTYSLSSGYLPNRSDIYDDERFIEQNNMDNYSALSSERVVASVFNFAKNLNDSYFTEAPFKGSTNIRSDCSYLNSALYSAAKQGTATEEFIAQKFQETYNGCLAHVQ